MSYYHNKPNNSYSTIYDNINNARTFTALRRVVEHCLPELYKLDDNQQERLEAHGMRRFNQIQMEMLKIEGMIKSKRY